MKEIRVNHFCFLNLNEKIIRIELHGFADSSNTVYCAVVYLEVVTSSAVKVFFLASKNSFESFKHTAFRVIRVRLISQSNEGD